MGRLAVITARGGSKRIPRKNIKEFCGKPILCYSIEAALASGIFDEVMVSTDDEEIAQVAGKAGAQVPFMRSEETSGDFATTRDVLVEVVERYREGGRCFEQMCCIYPTAPFVTAQKLRTGMELLEQAGADFVCPVVRYSFPPQRSYVIREGRLCNKWPEYRTARSQDLEPFYHDCGQFYMYRTQSLMEKAREDWIQLPMVMPELEVQDIDNEEDWYIAQIKYQQMIQSKRDLEEDKV